MDKLQIMINVTPCDDGTARMTVSGAIDDKTRAYEMLTEAAVQIRNYHIHKEQQRQEKRIVLPEEFLMPGGHD